MISERKAYVYIQLPGALETETAEYFAEKAKKANIPEFLSILNRQGGEPPRPDDVLPDE